jgi:hypothetical protein
MVNDFTNYSRKDAKNSDVVGKFSFFRTHDGGNRSQLNVPLCVRG